MQRGALRGLGALGDRKGSAIMLLVAFLWSLTSTFDKMGMAASPTLAAYLAVQRAMTAAPCVLYLALKDVRSFRCDAALVFFFLMYFSFCPPYLLRSPLSLLRWCTCPADAQARRMLRALPSRISIARA